MLTILGDFPATAKRLIHGDQGRGGQGFTVSETILGFQQGAFGVEDRQKVCYPELIPLARQVLCLLTRLRRGIQQVTAFLLAGKIDQEFSVSSSASKTRCSYCARALRFAHRRL